MFEVIALIGSIITYIASFKNEFSKEHVVKLTTALIVILILIIAISVLSTLLLNVGE